MAVTSHLLSPPLLADRASEEQSVIQRTKVQLVAEASMSEPKLDFEKHQSALDAMQTLKWLGVIAIKR